MGNFFQFVQPFLFHGVMFRIRPTGVHGPPVYADHAGSVVGAFHPPFDLKAADPRLHQFRQIGQQAEVFGVHDVGAPFVPGHVVDFSGPVLLRQAKLPAADLGAGAPVPVPAGQVTAEPAPSRIGDAHSSVHEGFQFHVSFAADFFYFRQGKLPGQHHAAGAQVFPGFHGRPVAGVRLGAHVQRHIGNHFPGHGPDSQIGDQESVCPRVLQAAQVIRQRVDIFVMGKNIYGHVNFFL